MLLYYGIIYLLVVMRSVPICKFSRHNMTVTFD